MFFGSTSRIRSFIFSHRPTERTARFDNLSPIITQPAVACARQNFLTRWAYIYHSGARGWPRCLVPCRSGGGQVFRLISRCNFSPFSKRGPPTCSCAFEGSGSPPLERKSKNRGPLFSRTGGVDSTFPVKLALNLSPCIMSTHHVPYGTDYDFSCDNSIITPDLLRSVEHFWYSLGRRLAAIYSRCA